MEMNGINAVTLSQRKPRKAFDVCSFIVTIILGAFFGKYAFRNPDVALCFAGGSDVAYFAGGPLMTDVTYRFKVWFEWGFIYNCVTFL